MKKLIIASLLVAGNLVAGSSYGQRGVAPVRDDFYKAECASCHFAYQPGLLPAKSWTKLMGDLSNHFGVDASLDSADNQKLLKYLLGNSAEKFTEYKRSRRINDSIAAYETPIAVTKTRYFIQKHREIAPRLIERKEVRSLANCTACHTTADKGSYGERAIKIPNYGRWDND